ncbi:MAG: HAD family phosphatase [Deltaproteobacteria bacterium]|nr:HAD family phosphatase [Deltaproteobacteria bacterium]MBI2342162.1 HAD family phosphatase [Deltaproteobacteria bacterium]MBI2974554.1 HAD family phosphatase [Deltaproteobacteria bacterium]
MIKAIIFDLDDLMANSSPLHFEAYEKALKDFGIKAPKIEGELRQKIYGMRIKEIMRLLADEFKMAVDVEELTRHRNAYFMELVNKGVQPMPGLFELVENVKKWGFKRALASSGVTEYVNEVIAQFKLNDFFEAAVTGDDVLNPKPAPDCFLLAAKKLQVDPKHCAVLEDSTNGLIAAKSAKMLAIGVKNSLLECGQDMSMADIVVNRLDEITLEMLNYVIQGS